MTFGHFGHCPTSPAVFSLAEILQKLILNCTLTHCIIILLTTLSYSGNPTLFWGFKDINLFHKAKTELNIFLFKDSFILLYAVYCDIDMSL